MKNIILIGASRAGKSTFTKLLNERLKIMVIRTDLLRLAFREAIYKDNSISMSVVKDNKDYKDLVLSYYKYANMYEVDYVKVVDTVDFEPSECNAFENAIVICLGYHNISKEEVVSNWQKYDTPLDWTKNKPYDKLLMNAELEINNSKKLKKDCEKYNIKYVDTSYDREKVLNELVDYVLKKI